MKTNTLLIIAGAIILIAIVIAVYSSRKKETSVVATNVTPESLPPRSVGNISVLPGVVSTNNGDSSRILTLLNGKSNINKSH